MDERKSTAAWRLHELALEVGLSARTVRFYIARGLLPGPEKAGRGATYGPNHLQRLREIVALQSEGLTLAEIGARGKNEPRSSLPPPVSWWSFAIADGVEVKVRADQSPWRLRRIRREIEALTDRLAHEFQGPERSTR